MLLHNMQVFINKHLPHWVVQYTVDYGFFTAFSLSGSAFVLLHAFKLIDVKMYLYLNISYVNKSK